MKRGDECSGQKRKEVTIPDRRNQPYHQLGNWSSMLIYGFPLGNNRGSRDNRFDALLGEKGSPKKDKEWKGGLNNNGRLSAALALFSVWQPGVKSISGSTEF